ncbi:hypothetical protein NUW54_g4261 [Trametes sanguinea]|uniref:Uncharacterized protein n=1 Tax=Trametes sanguinea TaxID=158606 RepID=A0ACC1Q008_9APHY|nr:hypothetical protein NUW54_g4261 [Trametes sanguinea]
MYSCTAPGCQASFSRNIGLGLHRLTCKHRFAAFKNALASRSNSSSSEPEDENRARKRRKHGEDEISVEPPCHVPSPTPEPPTATQTRSGRTVRVPKRFADFVPSNAEELPAHIAETCPASMLVSSPTRYRSPTVEDAAEADEDLWELEPDAFGLFRTYTEPVQRDPEASRLPTVHPPGDSSIPDSHPCYQNVSWLSPDRAGESNSESPSLTLGPFPNCSQFRLTDWWHNASLTKSQEDFNNLLDLLRSKGFSIDDLEGLHAHQAQKLLDDFASPTGDASNPPLEEKVNQAESLLKVEACGRANADGRTQKGGDAEGIWIVGTLRVGIYKRESATTAEVLRKQCGTMPRRRAACANAFAPGALSSGDQCRARRARQGLARLPALPDGRKQLLEVVWSSQAFAGLRCRRARSRAQLRVFAQA